MLIRRRYIKTESVSTNHYIGNKNCIIMTVTWENTYGLINRQTKIVSEKYVSYGNNWFEVPSLKKIGLLSSLNIRLNLIYEKWLLKDALKQAGEFCSADESIVKNIIK